MLACCDKGSIELNFSGCTSLRDIGISLMNDLGRRPCFKCRTVTYEALCEFSEWFIVQRGMVISVENSRSFGL